VKFPNSGRVYRIMPKGAKPIARPNLRALSDAQLVEMQMHTNDWYVRHARVLLQARAAAGKLDSTSVHKQLEVMLKSATKSPKRLRALWALNVTGGLNSNRLSALLGHDDEYVRAWAIQFLCDASNINAFQDASNTESLSLPLPGAVLDKFAAMAKNDSSQVVRLYLASAVQRLPFAKRWSILRGLVSHAEDVDDNNLPRMYWFCLEPMVPAHPKEALGIAVAGKIPNLRQFVARRMATGGASPSGKQVQSTPKPQWQQTIQKVAPGFRVRDVGERGVVHHKSFRNAIAVQTHPLNRKQPCVLYRELKIPANKKTKLRLRVSHHSHGDWQLRVLADKKVVADRIIGSKTVSNDEWLELSVDLTPFKGKTIQLTIENRANNWHNEWAYWNKVQVVSE
jgi:hypothetical protein